MKRIVFLKLIKVVFKIFLFLIFKWLVGLLRIRILVLSKVSLVRVSCVFLLLFKDWIFFNILLFEKRKLLSVV